MGARIKRKVKLTNEDIDRDLDPGWKRLSDYINCRTRLLLACPNDHICGITWNNYYYGGTRCKECSSRYYDNDRVDRILREQRWARLEDYAGQNTPLLCRCPQGHISRIRMAHFLNGHRCFRCWWDYARGENSLHWKMELTKEERQRQRNYPEYRQYRQDVFERDDYTCRVCLDSEGGNLEVHHLFSYAAYPEHRTSKEFSITLCNSCHFVYHAECGKGLPENTPTQFREWLSAFSPAAHTRLSNFFDLPLAA